MRPGTFHAVITPVPTIVHGGYLLCHTTIKNTILGIYQGVISDENLTNVDNMLETRILLAQMAMMWYECFFTGELAAFHFYK